MEDREELGVLEGLLEKFGVRDGETANTLIKGGVLAVGVTGISYLLYRYIKKRRGESLSEHDDDDDEERDEFLDELYNSSENKGIKKSNSSSRIERDVFGEVEFTPSGKHLTDAIFEDDNTKEVLDLEKWKEFGVSKYCLKFKHPANFKVSTQIYESSYLFTIQRIDKNVSFCNYHIVVNNAIAYIEPEAFYKETISEMNESRKDVKVVNEKSGITKGFKYYEVENEFIDTQTNYPMCTIIRVVSLESRVVFFQFSRAKHNSDSSLDTQIAEEIFKSFQFEELQTRGEISLYDKESSISFILPSLNYEPNETQSGLFDIFSEREKEAKELKYISKILNNIESVIDVVNGKPSPEEKDTKNTKDGIRLSKVNNMLIFERGTDDLKYSGDDIVDLLYQDLKVFFDKCEIKYEEKEDEILEHSHNSKVIYFKNRQKESENGNILCMFYHRFHTYMLYLYSQNETHDELYERFRRVVKEISFHELKNANLQKLLKYNEDSTSSSTSEDPPIICTYTNKEEKFQISYNASYKQKESMLDGNSTVLFVMEGEASVPLLLIVSKVPNLPDLDTVFDLVMDRRTKVSGVLKNQRKEKTKISLDSGRVDAVRCITEYESLTASIIEFYTLFIHNDNIFEIRSEAPSSQFEYSKELFEALHSTFTIIL